MPLNLKQDTESPEKGASKPGPILHKPKQNIPGGSTFLIAFFVIIVLGAIVFLLYRFDFIGGKKSPPPETVFTQTLEESPAMQPETSFTSTPMEDQTTQPVTPIVEEKPAPITIEPTPKRSEPKPKPQAKEPTPVVSKGTGEYTVYIGSYKNKSNAENEVDRWTKAGYPAFMAQASEWYRVAIGKYGTTREAKNAAEKMKESFEYGYWVGRVK